MIAKTYEEKVLESASEKVTLVWLEPSSRAVIWELVSGSIYKRPSSLYVVNLKVATTSLTEASSSSLSQGEWFFDSQLGVVFVRMTDDSNPQESFVSLVHRLFLSDSPYVATHNLLDNGNAVEYDARIDSVPSFPQEIDSADQLGIALESSGSISFINEDGFFDSIFDKLFWANKDISIYSWFPDTKFSEAKRIFKGVIDDPRYSPKKVTFKVKDEIFKLRSPLSLGLFSLSDGEISDDVIGRQKRRIYGSVIGLKTQSIEQTLAGFSLIGTISATSGSVTVIGVGTSFLSDVSPGDLILVEDEEISIDSVESNTSLTAAVEIDKTFSDSSAIIDPEIPVTSRNRTHIIAGHKLREPSTTVSIANQLNRIEVNDPSDFLEGDLIKVGPDFINIKRISGNLFVLRTNLDNVPAPGTSVVKNPVSAVYFNGKKMVIDRDWSISNLSSVAKLILTSSAEFNIAKINKVRGSSITFTNASRTVTGSGTVFTKDFSSRDFTRSVDTLHTTFYEILEVVDDSTMIIRTPYAGSSTTDDAQKKNVTYVNDDTPVLVDCVGMENSAGEWVKTASDAVKDILENDALFTDLDTNSFSQADIEAPYILSLALPLNRTSDSPKVRDVISLINKSVLGSLVERTDFSVAFNILLPEKPESLEVLKDDDIINFTVTTRNNVKRKISGKYKHFDADIFTLENGNSIIEFENEFVDNLIGTKDSKVVDLYLLESQAAQIITERYAFIHSLPQQLVTVNSKLNLTLKNINDKLFLNLDRMYERFGSSIRQKIGIINKIVRSGQDTRVTFSDLSGMFSRVANIADDSAADFADASDAEKMINGYIVDDITELPDSSSDEEWGINLIG